MKSLEKGQDKIQKICDKIRRETIEPAKKESAALIDAAHHEAEDIIQEAKKQAERLIKDARLQVEQERNVFQSSLEQAAKQALEGLRQEIENKFFNEELSELLEQQLADPQLIAQLINGIVKAIEKEGLNTDLTAVIPRVVPANQIELLLLENVRKKLANRPLEIGNFAGGAQVKLVGKKMTLDLTNQAIKELIAAYMRKDFRQLIFSR